MTVRFWQHIGFWILYISLYALLSNSFPGTSDLVYPPWQRFGRFWINELLFLPWKMIPFYALFYWLIPQYFHKKQYPVFALLFCLILMFCMLGYRSMTKPVSYLMYQEWPEFNTYSSRRLIYAFTELLPALGIASSIKLIRGRMAAQRREKALEKEKLAAELNFLKAQTNPHFLFNTLNNLYGLARKQDVNTAPSIMKLSNIMRYILHECSSNFVPIRKEVRIIEDYIELEQLRFDEHLEVHFNHSIDEWETDIAPLILMPFVENAFKHGASESRFGAKVLIDLQLSQQELYFRVSNTIEDTNHNKINKGVGLQNVERQLELIYPDRHHLQIQLEANYFISELWVQLMHDETGKEIKLSNY